MLLLKKLSIIYFILLSIVVADYLSYDYAKKEQSIQTISSKMVYVIPAFSFISDDYKEFAYDK